MLFLVPTPIGNLKDMTFRAIEVLQNADLILAEDTRKSGLLLKHFDISSPMRAYHAHNEHHVTQAIVKELEAGKKIALITDAGTPAISDPGFLLVRACHEANVMVSCLPGPSALLPALAKRCNISTAQWQACSMGFDFLILVRKSHNKTLFNL